MPLFNLEIYFGKVAEHDNYFRGKGLGSWPVQNRKSKQKRGSRRAVRLREQK